MYIGALAKTGFAGSSFCGNELCNFLLTKTLQDANHTAIPIAQKAGLMNFIGIAFFTI
jgi:hypothetical protein